MTIKIEALRVFLVVAEFGNISSAASALNKTPSAVSMTLKQLEKSLGGALFEGDRKHQLSELGRLTRDVAKVQLTSYNKAVDTLRAFARNETGHISIASVHSQINLIMPSVIRRFTRERPDVTLDWLNDENESVAEKVADLAVDLGICEEPPDRFGLNFEPLLNDPFHVWFAAQSALARFARPFNWRDLRHLTLIRSPITDNIRAEAYRQMAARSQLRVSDLVALGNLIETGESVAILPMLPALDKNQHLLHRPLQDARARRRLGLVRPGNAPARPGVEIISALIREACANPLFRPDPD